MQLYIVIFASAVVGLILGHFTHELVGVLSVPITFAIITVIAARLDPYRWAKAKAKYYNAFVCSKCQLELVYTKDSLCEQCSKIGE